ncbi:Hypothetical protein NTJ_00742 [Nesidiocoris tenuis]|uniref:Uncharacterized protein n=1 Tax=Nesidiocoris tenuis TaxID=355587 RepID=A0ABN7A6R6_9HEMI|nr:Hypothetical protein NTJ_00742 [Nesidiocoris tenuis]
MFLSQAAPLVIRLRPLAFNTGSRDPTSNNPQRETSHFPGPSLVRLSARSIKLCSFPPPAGTSYRHKLNQHLLGNFSPDRRTRTCRIRVLRTHTGPARHRTPTLHTPTLY